ncbi:MAG: hypothetical protein J6Y94_07805 [Bacteriovoracaceae bacterium]|nr:hypothetical protein [Bacteriovoracaceae bacterium]
MGANLSGQEFQKGVAALEDLAQLGPYTNAPLIGRAYHHFSLMKAEMDEQLAGAVFSPPLRKFFHQGLVYLLRDHLGCLAEFPQGDIHFSQWNKMLAALPILIKIAKCLPWPKVEKTLIQNGLIIMQGQVPAQDAALVNKRSTIYQYFRQLLGLKCLLTYDLTDPSVTAEVAQGETNPQLTLQLDLRHREDLVYHVPVGDGICFSSIFPSYKAPDWAAVAALGPHLCLVIHPDGQSEELGHIPEHFRETFPSAELLHFRFLFRPVSLIIPGKGEIISAQAEDTGRETLASNSLPPTASSYVDIFSLLAN